MEDLEDALDMLTFHLSIINSSAMIKKEMLSMFNQLNLSMFEEKYYFLQCLFLVSLKNSKEPDPLDRTLSFLFISNNILELFALTFIINLCMNHKHVGIIHHF